MKPVKKIPYFCRKYNNVLRFGLTFLGFVLVTSVFSQDLQRGLIACYSFTGNAIDGTGNQNNGTVYGATLTQDRFGNANSAYYFNGTITNYISLPPAQFEINNYSYSVWVSASSIPDPGNTGLVFSIGDQYTSRQQSISIGNVYSTGNYLGWGVGGWNNGPTLTSGLAAGYLPVVDQWYHVVVTRSDTEVTMYLNGQFIGNAPTDGYTAYYGTSTLAYLGMRCSSIQPYNGKIDDFSIYNREITQQEVTLLYQNGLACSLSSPPPTVAGLTLCGNGSAVLTASDGTTYRWYDAPTGGNLLFEGNPFTTPNLTSTTNYYVSNTVNGSSESTRVKVTVTITPLSICCPTPTANGTSFCGPASTVLTASGASTYRWYDALTGGNLLFEGNPFTTPTLTSTTFYYVANFQNNKESPRVKVTATVLPKPQLTCNFSDLFFLSSVSSFSTSVTSGTSPYQYLFDFGDGSQLSTSKPEATYLYPSEGDYNIVVSVTDANNCTSECSKQIEILGNFFIPNVITYNTDTLNDRLTLFVMKGESFIAYAGNKTFSLQIIDRWGKEIYITNDPTKGWNAGSAASGTYFYLMSLGNRRFKGWVSVL
ncbi:MAG: gliding motility-associated C-terminal domain-containing protein [Cyclobacteriaceae bacterium]